MLKEIFCPDTKEKVYDYESYLKTKHWKMKRIQIAKQRKYTCEICGVENEDEKKFNIHHNTYENIGNELDSDLNLLCETCHISIHKEMKLNILSDIPKEEYYRRVINTKKLKLGKNERKLQINTIKKTIKSDIANDRFDRIDMVYDTISNHYETMVYTSENRLKYILKHIDNPRISDYRINRMHRIILESPKFKKRFYKNKETSKEPIKKEFSNLGENKIKVKNKKILKKV